MKVVTRYETEDGKTFETEDDALAHEKAIRCAKAYENNKLYTYVDEGEPLPWKDVSQWLDDNIDLVADYLGLYS